MPDINVNKLSEALNTKADIDLNNTGVFSTSGGGGVNLTSSTPADANGKEVTSADFIKSDIQSNLLNYTTNRILEIPQDIKLELNNGTLTLKAGSKVYVPNGKNSDGSNKFDVVTIESDVTYSAVYTSAVKCYALYDYSAKRLQMISLTDNRISYDSATNKVIHTGLSDNVLSFPFALVVRDTTGIGSIEQVFNGFGYIGSTIFALPGIKCQFADGRNEDGSYKSYVKTTDKILTKTFGAETFNGFDCSLVCRNDIIDGFAWHVNEDFDNKSGYIMINKTERIDKNLCPVFRFFINPSSGNGKISQFIPNPVDKLNWKSTELSGLSMPSSRYIDLTLGASGSTYTAPANGWFAIAKVAGADFYYTDIVVLKDPNGGTAQNNHKFGTFSEAYRSSPCESWADVKKGDVVIVNYNATGVTNYFRFIYAEGEN